MPPPKKPLPGGRFIRSTTWPAIYRAWYRQEGQRADWRRHLRQRGFSSWRAWRQAVIVRPFGLDRRRWALYAVTDVPSILDWHGGPFPGWRKKYYAGAQTRSFRWLVEDGKIRANRKVGKFKNLPRTMQVFGLRYRNRVIIIDGMHRCCKLALAAAKKKHIRVIITLALAETKKLPKLKSTMV